MSLPRQVPAASVWSLATLVKALDGPSAAAHSSLDAPDPLVSEAQVASLARMAAIELDAADLQAVRARGGGRGNGSGVRLLINYRGAQLNISF